jgi:hypothetical protein
MTFCLTGFLITRTICRFNYQPLGGHGYNKSRVTTLEEKLKMVEECRQTIEEWVVLWKWTRQVDKTSSCHLSTNQEDLSRGFVAYRNFKGV